MPGERACALHLVSTIYPSLPREEIRTFQMALIGGTVLVALLGILGLFPVAIAAAALLVPLITIIYLYDVDVYEDEPIRVIALTFLWGAVTGALFAYALQAWFPHLRGGPRGQRHHRHGRRWRHAVPPGCEASSRPSWPWSS